MELTLFGWVADPITAPRTAKPRKVARTPKAAAPMLPTAFPAQIKHITGTQQTALQHLIAERPERVEILAVLRGIISRDNAAHAATVMYFRRRDALIEAVDACDPTAELEARRTLRACGLPRLFEQFTQSDLPDVKPLLASEADHLIAWLSFEWPDTSIDTDDLSAPRENYLLHYPKPLYIHPDTV